MSFTKSQLCSMSSMIYLGAGSIVDIETDQSVAATAYRTVYPLIEEKLLREFTWNFATKRSSLAKNAVSPAFEYSSKHTLPADFMRIDKINNYDGAYVVEGNSILSNHSGNLEIVYITNNITVSNYSPLFSALMAAELAAAAGLQIRGDGFKASRDGDLERDLRELRKQAKLLDSQDSRKKEQLRFDKYQNSRRIRSVNPIYIER